MTIFAEILFAKIETAGLFGRKEISLNQQNKPVRKNIGRI
jgi:hypothetical protein